MGKLVAFCVRHRVFGLMFGLLSMGLLVAGPKYIQQVMPAPEASVEATFNAVAAIMVGAGLVAAISGFVLYLVGCLAQSRARQVVH